MVLADALYRLGLNPVLAHIDHGLREESRAEGEFVAEFARVRNLDFRAEQLEPEELLHAPNGLQAAARNLRYKALKRIASGFPNAAICVAHQADDRLEGLLISFIRAERWDRLAGMSVWNGEVFRPFLHIKRSEIEDYAREFKIEWREDPSNAGDRYLRNRVRKQLTPFLKSENPNWLQTLDRIQGDLRMASGVLRKRAAEWSSKWIHTELVEGLGNMDRIANEAFSEAEGRDHFLNWLDSKGMKRACDPEQLFLSKPGAEFRANALLLYRTSQGFELSAEAVERAAILLPEWMESIRWPIALNQSETKEIEKSADCAVLDKRKLHFPLTLRNPRTGDRLEPLGMKGSKLLSDLMSEDKMNPSAKKSTWLVCSDDQIVWWVGKRVDRRFAATADDRVLWKMKLAKN